MDNTGRYLKYDELILELKFAKSPLVVAIGDVTLSNKTADAGGAIFDFTPAAPVVKVGDVVNQLGKSAIVKAVLAGPDRLQLEDNDDATTDVENGAAEILRSESLPRFRGEDIIDNNMSFIDEQTAQFFNKRTGTFKLEGANHPVLWFPVPIIEITKLVINSTDLELIEGEDDDFFAFKGRAVPQDDRRNPRIKLNVGRGRDSIFTGASTNRIFSQGTLTTIDGSFGFLEPNGDTPPQIQRAILLLSAKEANNPGTSSSATSGQGPEKRIKVDLHEKEFFENKQATSKGSLSGIPEVDQIIARFRSPIRIGGSTMLKTFAESNRTRVF